MECVIDWLIDRWMDGWMDRFGMECDGDGV